jgi:hypothetical protein
MGRVVIVESLSGQIEGDAAQYEFSTHLLSVNTLRMSAVLQFSNRLP